MPRKKKTEETKEQVEEENKKDEKEVAITEISETTLKENSEQETEGEEKPRKKKEIKKLSEKELKRVMTDTKETLLPLTDYISCSVHLGTKVITPEMRKFVYKRRADGLAVINTNLFDDKLREAVTYLTQFNPEDIFIVCKREAGWPAVEKFSKILGIKCFTKKYPAGIITNLQLEDFFEAKLVIICDPWVDKNALNDSLKVGLPVLGICDTNNYTKGIEKVIPANNKSRKSIGLVLYVLTREFLKANGKTKEAKELRIEDFTGKLENQESAERSERMERTSKENSEMKADLGV